MLHFFVKGYKFYIKSSIHVAFAVVALSATAIEAIGHSPKKNLLIFIYCSAVSAYNFVKFFPLLKKRKFTAIGGVVIGFSALCILIALVLFFELTLPAMCIVGVGALMVFLYSTPILALDFSGREIQGLKIYWVVLSWVILCVGVPLVEYRGVSFIHAGVLILTVALYVFVAILPFDIRDINADARSLKTLPQQLGVKKAKHLGVLLLIIGMVLPWMAGYTAAWCTATNITFLILAVLLWKSNPQCSFSYTHFWVEALPLFWWLAYIFFSYLQH